MKRVLSVLLIGILLLSGCSHTDKSFESPSNFYYRISDPVYDASEGIIVPEKHETAGCTADLVALLNRYLEGPYSSKLKLPMLVATPPVCVVSAVREGSRITVYFSSEFAKLSGIDLTIACSCISKTLFDYTNAKEVEIFAKDALLDGNTSIILYRDSLITSDNTATTIGTSKGEQ